MNPYRIALILCRVVALNLWWGAGVGLVSAGLLTLIGWLGWLGSPAPVAANTLYYALATTVLGVIVAVFVGQFAPAIATAAVGRGSLEGDAIAARTVLDAHERALASIGAGLTLLFLGIGGALIATVWGVYSILFDASAGVAHSFMVSSAVSGLLPAFLRCAIGFVLAFGASLRRMITPETRGETT